MKLIHRRIGLFLWFKFKEMGLFALFIGGFIGLVSLLLMIVNSLSAYHHLLKEIFFYGFLIFLVVLLLGICWDWLRFNWKEVCRIIPQ